MELRHILIGVDQYLSINPQTNFIFGSGDFSIELWVYPTALNGTIISQYVSDHVDFVFSLRLNNGVPEFVLSDTGDINSSVTVSGAALTLNEWTHLEVSRSGLDLMIFQEGRLKSSSAKKTFNRRGTFFFNINLNWMCEFGNTQ